LVQFAGFKNHRGFYPTPSGIAAFKNELKAYVWAKGSIRFPLDRALPVKLMQKIVKFRIKGFGKAQCGAYRRGLRLPLSCPSTGKRGGRLRSCEQTGGELSNSGWRNTGISNLVRQYQGYKKTALR
jgi:hypothetical protein